MIREETYGKEDSKDKRDSGGHPVALEEDKVEVETHLHHYHQGRVGWGIGHFGPKYLQQKYPKYLIDVKFLYLTKMHATKKFRTVPMALSVSKSPSNWG